MTTRPVVTFETNNYIFHNYIRQFSLYVGFDSVIAKQRKEGSVGLLKST